jgi:hypothetical protein
MVVDGRDSSSVMFRRLRKTDRERRDSDRLPRKNCFQVQKCACSSAMDARRYVGRVVGNLELVTAKSERSSRGAAAYVNPWILVAEFYGGAAGGKINLAPPCAS